MLHSWVLNTLVAIATGILCSYPQLSFLCPDHDIVSTNAHLNFVLMREIGPYRRDLYLPQLHIANAEDNTSHTCPNQNIIEVVAQYHQISFGSCENRNFITPETWNSVAATRLANKKSPPSIGHIYSSSIIGIQHASKGASVTPNRTPLHMLAIYTHHMPDQCIDPTWIAPVSEARPRKGLHYPFHSLLRYLRRR